MLYLVYPLVDITDEAARERRRLLAEQDSQHLDLNLSGLSRLTNIDFAKFDLDQPLPEGLTTNGHQSSLASWIGKTPRELAIGSRRQGYEMVGSADSVASRCRRSSRRLGGDGFLIFNTYFDRRYVMEICDGLVPELQRRDLVRKAYAHKHLRDNLLEF